MMMSTRETRRALEKEGDDDNDNKVVATNKHWPLRITKTFILVHKKSALTCTPIHATRRSVVFSKNRRKKKTLPVFTPHNI